MGLEADCCVVFSLNLSFTVIFDEESENHSVVCSSFGVYPFLFFFINQLNVQPNTNQKRSSQFSRVQVDGLRWHDCLLRDLPGGHSSSYEWCSQTAGGPVWRGSAVREDSAPQSDTGELPCLSVRAVQPAASVKRKVGKNKNTL